VCVVVVVVVVLVGASSHNAVADACLGALQAKRCSKLEARGRVFTAGYQKRSDEGNAALQATFLDIDNNTLELACFRRLATDETEAIPGRVAAAEAEARDVAEREQELQLRYKNLVEEREQLVAVLNNA